MRQRICLSIVSLLSIAPSTAAPEAPAYRATATIEARRESVDQRFAVRGQARLAPASTSADGRFGVQATVASCDPADERLFGDGFEAP